jgi:hypothetical protein
MNIGFHGLLLLKLGIASISVVNIQVFTYFGPVDFALIRGDSWRFSHSQFGGPSGGRSAVAPDRSLGNAPGETPCRTPGDARQTRLLNPLSLAARA